MIIVDMSHKTLGVTSRDNGDMSHVMKGSEEISAGKESLTDSRPESAPGESHAGNFPLA